MKNVVKICSILLAGMTVLADPPPEQQGGYPSAGSGDDLLNPVTATNIVYVLINAGQLAGVDNSGGSITNAASLLPAVFQSLTIRDDGGDVFLVDESGAYAVNISAGSFGFLTDGGGSSNAVSSWNDVIERLDWGAVSNLPPLQAIEASQLSDNLIQVENLDFDPHQAIGPEGAIQYNASGQLSGSGDLNVDASSGRMQVRSEGNTILRAFWGDDTNSTFRIYEVRRNNSSAEVVLCEYGVENTILRGDGSASFVGTVEADRIEAQSIQVENAWYIPQAGDLSMGTFTSP